MEIKAKRLSSLKEKSQGLIGQVEIEPVYFETRFGIHTFFMKCEIDVAILDKDNKVVSLKKGLKPNKIFLWNPIYKRVLELPAGTINRLSLKTDSPVNLLIS